MFGYRPGWTRVGIKNQRCKYKQQWSSATVADGQCTCGGFEWYSSSCWLTVWVPTAKVVVVCKLPAETVPSLCSCSKFCYQQNAQGWNLIIKLREHRINNLISEGIPVMCQQQPPNPQFWQYMKAFDRSLLKTKFSLNQLFNCPRQQKMATIELVIWRLSSGAKL